MNLKYIVLPIISLSLLVSVPVCAQERERDALPVSGERDNKTDSLQNPPDFTLAPCISPFVELMGKGFFSLNVDFRRKETFAISLGVAAIEEGISPGVMGYYLGGRRHRFETGGGVSGNMEDGKFISMMVHGVIGYRYQKKKGLFFRAGFTPMFAVPFTEEGKFAVIPWAGLSLGYSF
ncbi:MAG TPA: hypothetical protein PLJ84_09575 [Bacteroidales bacterium]|nr:hypothetical protein [Bacteroidales bacterium]